ncbi:O-GlcNAcase NagJ precursor [Paraliobacillus sp. PM-2]|uniref:discoidin domain-containing protein n=1 Tax=Paraliobacillus sp. PM-2 TaxID=1462524 RepID=UPI00061BD67A|nr:discoidin domain-containing protein [Paraliobacillus sp. PM-2]CQR47243.1 O-GlcNAcase NagJ precursor [Paraliobacillus sp. PM-2]
MKMKKIVVCFLTLLLFFSQGHVFVSSNITQAANNNGRDYYISSVNGDNQHDASTPETAWETLDKLKEITLQPGDRILLESGSVFNGFIHFKDVHGTVDNPIVLSSYGEGDRPIINGNGEGVWYQDYGKQLDNPGHKYKGYVSSTLLFYDSDFIEVSNIEITNQSDDWEYMLSKEEQLNDRMDRTGVAGIAQNDGTMEHIYLDNLFIHDVAGNLENKHMNNGGIQFNVLQPENEETTGIARYQDIKITNNHVKDVHRAGIVVGYTYQFDKFTNAEISDQNAQKYGHTDILIQGNYVQDIGNDGIVAMYAYQPLIKNNVADTTGADLDDGYSGYWQSFSAGIWPWKTKDAVFEYNEVFDTVGEGNGDGQAWDIDYSDGTIYQYNYSHNNGGGALLVCLYQSINGTFRYNISQNDLKSFITFQSNPMAKIYNNIFYIDGDRATRIHHPSAGKRTGEGYLANNIFYNVSTNNPNDEWNPNNNKQFTNNLYFGYETTPSNDEYAITDDPQFLNPGSAPETTAGVIHPIDAFAGYKVSENSPVVNQGTYISNNTTVDYFNNPIGLIPDIGIHEVDGSEENVEKILSDAYTILEDKIVDVPDNTTLAEFIGNIKKSTSTSLQVKNGDTSLNNEDVIQDGDVLTATFFNGSEKHYTIHLKKNYTEYATDGVVASAGSQQSGEGPALALDGDTSTIWHTAWSGTSQDNIWVSLDLQEVKPIAMLRYVPRQSGGINGIFTKYAVFVKENETDEWNKVSTYTDSWEVNNKTKYAYFDTVQARYIKLQAIESATQQEPTLFGSAAEIRVGYEDSSEGVE